MKDDKYIEMCYSLERMAGMVKEVMASKEYKTGIRIQSYMNLLKNGRILEIVNRLTNNTSALNEILDTENYQFDNSPDKFQSSERIAVYTALFGKYDQIESPIIHPENIDYYLITDINIQEANGWKIIEPTQYLPNIELTNIEKNRYFKMFPHIVFSNYKYSIYVDANVLIVSDLTPMVRAMGSFPLAMFRHKNRDCVYQEATACIKKKKELKVNLEKHIEYMKSNGIPQHAGLLEATVIVRKHNNEICIDIMKQWWEEFLRYSKRDQLSLRDILWVNKIDLDDVGILGNNLYACNKFLIKSHL